MKRTPSLISKAILLAATLATGLAVTVPPAEAAFHIVDFGVSTTIGGLFSRQAGAHADLRTNLTFSAFPHSGPNGNNGNPDGNVKDAYVNLPPGFVGDPTAVPACPLSQLIRPDLGDGCPLQAMVGSVRVQIGYSNTIVPIYNLERPPSTPALLAFQVYGVPVFIEAKLRPGDYGVSAISARTSTANPVFGADITLWGIPADHGTGAPRLPFLTNTTSCSGTPVEFVAEADSWQTPGLFSTKSVNTDLEGNELVYEGCDRLGFTPSFTARPDASRAAAPTGLNVDIELPQNDGPDGLATATVRKTVVTLPKGVTLSPSSADGLDSCAPSQIALDTVDAPTCPGASIVGSVEIESPLVDEVLKGDVIVARQNDNPFNSLLAIYLSVKGPGFYLKLPGKVELDPQSGRLTTTFEDTPQLPFEHLRLSLRGGPSAPLVAPDACGTYNTRVEMTSWASDVPVSLESPMTIDQGCGTGGFAPSLHAGATNPVGGETSPFNLQVTRQDGEQNVARIDATLPEGELAKLAGVPLCGDAAAATGDCPASAQIGTTTVGVGAGSSPIYVPQPGRAPTAIYLAGPYKGAPYSLVVKVPAQAGPFDLGTVAVRSGIYVDPVTTQVSVKSDPLPQILQGIPIDYRDVRVEVNRPDFTLNPTSCDPMKVESTIVSDLGATASPSARFQVSGCERLNFKPKLSLALSDPTHRSAQPRLRATPTMPKAGAAAASKSAGANSSGVDLVGSTKRGGHPALRAVLEMEPGEANIARAQVNLPGSEFLDQGSLNKTCTKPVLLAGACPASTIYGHASAVTPLLDQPLEGNVYLVGGFGFKLPALVAELNGPIKVLLVGKIDSGKNHGIRTTFEGVPDAPVSKFVLEMKGGKKYGLLENSENLCKKTQTAIARFTGQNGEVEELKPTIADSCGKKKKGGGHGKQKA